MWQRQPSRQRNWRWLSILALVTLGCLSPGQVRAADPVDDLKEALFLRLEDLRNPHPGVLQFREASLKKCIAALTTMEQLRRGLALAEWKEDPGNVQIRDLDQQMRQLLGKRLEEAIAQIVQKGDPLSRLALANMVAEMGPAVRAINPADKRGFARSLTPLLAKLAQDADMAVRQEALRALGSINADPKVAVPIFRQTIQKDVLGPRRIAAYGLVQMVKVVSYLHKRGGAQAGVQADRADVLDVALEVVPATRDGAQDSDAQVRSQCLEAIQVVADSLSELVKDPYADSDFPPAERPLLPAETKAIQLLQQMVQEEVQELGSVLSALQARAAELASSCQDQETSVRLQAATALESLANIRLRMRRLSESIPLAGTSPKVLEAFLLKHDPLTAFLHKDFQHIPNLLRDEDVRLRRVAVALLESLDQAALPALPALVDCLKDPDRFVRWAATRVFKNFPAQSCGPAILPLANLLHDLDLNVRLSAAVTLDVLSQEARKKPSPLLGAIKREAVPLLAKACLSGDVESRTAAMLVLLSIGPEHAAAAVPAMIEGLRHHDSRLRRTAAEVLGKFGPVARPALPLLRDLLGDEDNDVRVQASDALLNIQRAHKE